jgi:hypothetical protein
MSHPGLPLTLALLAVPVAVLLFVVTLALLGDRRPAVEEPPPALMPPPRLLALPPASEPPAYQEPRFPYIPDERRRVN